MILLAETQTSPIVTGIVIAAFTALLAAFGWLVTSQVALNRSLSKAIGQIVTDFKIYITEQRERSKNKEYTCQLHRAQMTKDTKDMAFRANKIDASMLIFGKQLNDLEKRMGIVEADNSKKPVRRVRASKPPKDKED